MSRQRFPCRDRDGHDKRSGLRRSLVKAKRFCVATEICSVAIGFHGVVLRQGILCRDIVWPRPKGLVLRHNILGLDRVGQGQEFLCCDRVFRCRDRVWPWAGFLCLDRIFYVATQYGQMRSFVLRQRILGCDIVGQAGKICCRN